MTGAMVSAFLWGGFIGFTLGATLVSVFCH